MTNSSKKSFGTALIVAGIVAPFIFAQIIGNVTLHFPNGSQLSIWQQGGVLEILGYSVVCPALFILGLSFGLSLRGSAFKSEMKRYLRFGIPIVAILGT